MEQKLDLILSELQALSKRVSNVEQSMATKQDLKAVEERMATKQDLKAVEERMATKQDLKNVGERIDSVEERICSVEDRLTAKINNVEQKLDRLSEKVDRHHLESINADDILLNEIRTLRENVVFVNRRIADAELELNALKHRDSTG